jgi:hypothetical protein
LGRFLFLAEELASFPEAPAAQPAEPAEVACDGEEYEEEEAVEAEAEEEAVGSGLPERKASIRAFILAMDEAKLIAVVSSSRGSSGYGSGGRVYRRLKPFPQNAKNAIVHEPSLFIMEHATAQARFTELLHEYHQQGFSPNDAAAAAITALGAEGATSAAAPNEIQEATAVGVGGVEEQMMQDAKRHKAEGAGGGHAGDGDTATAGAGGSSSNTDGNKAGLPSGNGKGGDGGADTEEGKEGGGGGFSEGSKGGDTGGGESKEGGPGGVVSGGGADAMHDAKRHKADEGAAPGSGRSTGDERQAAVLAGQRLEAGDGEEDIEHGDRRDDDLGDDMLDDVGLQSGKRTRYSPDSDDTVPPDRVDHTGVIIDPAFFDFGGDGASTEK